MQTAQTISRGRAIGGMIFIFFGAIWLILGFYVRQQLTAAALCWIAGATLALAALGVRLLRQAPSVPPTAADRRRNRIFHCINAAQWIVAFLLVALLHRFQLDAYSVSVIAAVVGLHFVPLARLFRYPPNYATGALLFAWSALVAWKAPPDTLQGITALGAGAILWLSALVAFAHSAFALRRNSASLKSQAA
jgi:hypothetical protein